jgi:hypothetical protein
MYLLIAAVVKDLVQSRKTVSSEQVTVSSEQLAVISE